MDSYSTAPTAPQLAQVKGAIDTYLQSIDAHPDRRSGAYPYYQFHQPGQPIHGTVMIFHGFSARPHQMWRLSSYLFENGFNVYQCTLAGHSLIPPARHWPQVHMKREYAEPLKQKVQADRVLGPLMENFYKRPDSFTESRFTRRAALLARLLLIEPRLLDMKRAIERPHDPDFDRYFESNHMDYLGDAQARLAELEAMPGPIYTVGLSVGGAVALGLAAAAPNRIKKVVAYAPLLETYGADQRQYVELTGPLNLTEIGWDPDLLYPVACLTAADRFGGSYVRSQASIQTLRSIPTFLVLTENEDAADITTNQDFFEAIGGHGCGHRTYLYPADAMVPHPMVDPTEVSQAMSNQFWQSLYQETWRFLRQGEVDLNNMASLDPSPQLPPVPAV